MNEPLSDRAPELARPAATIPSGLAQAEAMIATLNDQLDELAMLGVTSDQIERPSIYARPAGRSGNACQACHPNG